MITRIYNVFLSIFFLTISVLFCFTVINYPGNALVYVIFTIALNALLVFGFTKDRILFDTFIGLFFWLGFWLKFSIRIAFMGGGFNEPTGNFDGTAGAYDRALIVTSCGIIALLIANFIRKKWFFSYKKANKTCNLEMVFALYRKRRIPILALFVALFVTVAATNIAFGIYQRGSVPRTILPLGLSGVYTWLLLFGLASASAVILDCEFKIRKHPYFVSTVCLFECFFSSVSMLSRGLILNGGALAIGTYENAKRRSFRLSLRFKLIVLIIFGLLFLFSVFAVNHIRTEYFVAPSAETFTSKFFVSKTFMPESALKSIRKIQTLFLDRWVGMEGVMAVSSYPDLGWGIWKKAWAERYSHSGTSMYDLTFIESQYLRIDLSKHHFIGMPGILAFFYYPGSYPFLFFSMLLLGFLGAFIEISLYKISGGNIILCSLMVQVVASRYAHFGYVPYQSYLLFGSIYLNVLLLFFLNKYLSFVSDRLTSE